MSQHQFAEETSFSFSQSVPVPQERRQDERHLTILRVGTLVCDGRRELCLIRNISAGGLMAHVYSGLENGQPVVVEFKTDQQVAGRVVWTRGANIGVEFDAPIDIEELLSSPAVSPNGWRPRMPRIEIDRMATIRAGAKTHWASVRDISLGGIKAETSAPPEAGTEVVVTLERFRPLPGVVRWVRNDVCGITFNQVIPFGELIQWLKGEN